MLSHRGQGVTFETAGNEQLAAGCEIVCACVIGARICNQGWSNCRRRGKVRAANDKQDDDGRYNLTCPTRTMHENCNHGSTVATVYDRRIQYVVKLSAVIDRRYKYAAVRRWRRLEEWIHKLTQKMRRT